MSVSDATVSALVVGLRWATAEITTLRSGGLIPNNAPKPIGNPLLLLNPDGSDDPDYPWPKEGKT